MFRGRLATAAGALVSLAVLVIGVPVALARLAGNPLPGSAPHLEDVLVALTSIDDGGLFMRGLALAGWLGWLSFLASLLVEAVGRVTRRHIPPLPALGAQQRLAAALLSAILATGAVASVASADAAPAARGQPDEVGPVPLPGPAEPAADAQPLHLVERGQALLDLQDRYGVPWQRIAEANYGTLQPDGRVFTRGHMRIYPGWQLRIPEPPESRPHQAAPGETDRTADEVETGTRRLQHTVADGDWLWHVAERYLGDAARFPEIAAGNPQYAERHSADGRLSFPDYLEPGWTLRLPADAVDRGAVPHAAGTVTEVVEQGQAAEAAGPQPSLEAPAPEASPAAPEGSPTPEAPTAPQASPTPEAPTTPQAPPEPEPSASTTAGETGQVSPPAVPHIPEQRPPKAETTPTPTAGPGDTGRGDVDHADGEFGPAPDLEALTPAALGSAGLLATLILGMVGWHRRRRRQHHGPDITFAPASARLERTLRTAQQPLDVARLDAALRHLAHGLAHRTSDLPDVAGALLEDGSVRLLLNGPCLSPPAPWLDDGDRWTLPVGAAPPEPGPVLAPLPTLAALGSQGGRHLLLDLERLGVLTLHGHPDATMALLRYLAAELACNSWSDTVDLLLAGFDPADAEPLTALRPERVRVLPTPAEGIRLLRRRTAAVAQRPPAAADAFAGRVQGPAGDGWMPQVLLVADPDEAARAALEELRQELASVGRCAVAAVTVGQGALQAGRWRVTVSADGVVHVRLPFLHACLSAAGLSRAELAGMADEVRQAQVGSPVPAPGADWASAPSTQFAPATDSPPEVGSPLEASSPLEAGPVVDGPPRVPGPSAEGDLYLDSDLGAWHADDPGCPRIGVLGPVRIDATGSPPQTRQRLHSELVVFLAQRGARGADAATLRQALWPDRHIDEADLQLAIARARRWLGVDPGGSPWLCEADETYTYRLAEGYLLDWQLFRRLRSRARGCGVAGAEDLRAALQLVRGVPLDGAERPTGPGARNPYPWLANSPLDPEYLVAAVVDTAGQLAQLCAGAGDTDGVRWAVRQAWLADAVRSYEQPWRDLMRAEHADGQFERLRAVLGELMEVRDAEAPEDLAPDTYHLVREWLPLLLGPPGAVSAGADASDWSA